MHAFNCSNLLVMMSLGGMNIHDTALYIHVHVHMWPYTTYTMYVYVHVCMYVVMGGSIGGYGVVLY